MNNLLGPDHDKKMEVINLMKKYAEDRDVAHFVRSLMELLAHPDEQQLLQEIRWESTCTCIYVSSVPLDDVYAFKLISIMMKLKRILSLVFKNLFACLVTGNALNHCDIEVQIRDDS